MNVAKTQELLYAVVGAGDFALEKAKNLSRVTDRKATTRVYKDFVKRGRSLSTRIRNSGTTKKAIAQTKTARTQVKAATTGVTKAVRANSRAAWAAAAKATKAS